ncbi:protein of unknown function [Candidatus Hydrogenisulfobacillus filiaventi]|uniref:Uncharacterized protein n=1 Tax=Candidatus Hydrogenisulfobacillus filiaventi TaxID=2707344 RepID=A0A6F8ZFU8_9FIRM|nr:protein of unknown function [Candidatus Hydrogenisulfobacillus filiaventi]
MSTTLLLPEPIDARQQHFLNYIKPRQRFQHFHGVFGLPQQLTQNGWHNDLYTVLADRPKYYTVGKHPDNCGVDGN